SSPSAHQHLPSFPTRRSSDLFDDTDVNPFPNQLEDAAVANPSLDERHELAPHNPVEVALNVGFEDICGCAVTHRAANRLERIVRDRKSTRLNSSHVAISYAVF